MNTTQIEDVRVLYVESPNGPEGAMASFDELDKRLPSLKGRRFYGTFMPTTGVYRACVAIEEGDDPQALGLPTWLIPGGKYAKGKVADWREHVPEIGQTFIAMSAEVGDHYDESRPSIEFYRSEREVVLLLPLK